MSDKLLKKFSSRKVMIIIISSACIVNYAKFKKIHDRDDYNDHHSIRYVRKRDATKNAAVTAI